MKTHCTGVILAGGLNRRFGGREKAFLHVGESTVLDRIYRVHRRLFDEVIIVTNNPPAYLKWDAHIATDLFAVRSSLTGIHAGMFYAHNPYVFCSACDTPFLEKALVETIVGAVEDRYDVVMPETQAGLEPLCAIYNRRCLKTVEHYLSLNRFKIQKVFRPKRLKRIPEHVVRRADPDLISFFNINTPEDLARARTLASERNTHESVPSD